MGPIGRWLTNLAIEQARRKGKLPGLGFNTLALTTTGRMRGLETSVPDIGDDQHVDREVRWEGDVGPNIKRVLIQGATSAHIDVIDAT